MVPLSFLFGTNVPPCFSRPFCAAECAHKLRERWSSLKESRVFHRLFMTRQFFIRVSSSLYVLCPSKTTGRGELSAAVIRRVRRDQFLRHSEFSLYIHPVLPIFSRHHDFSREDGWRVFLVSPTDRFGRDKSAGGRFVA